MRILVIELLNNNNIPNHSLRHLLNLSRYILSNWCRIAVEYNLGAWIFPVDEIGEDWQHFGGGDMWFFATKRKKKQTNVERKLLKIIASNLVEPIQNQKFSAIAYL